MQNQLYTDSSLIKPHLIFLNYQIPPLPFGLDFLIGLIFDGF